MLPNLILAALLSQPAQAPPPRKVAPPRLAVNPAGRVEFGSVGPTEVRSQLYTLRNTSDAPIQVRVLDLSPGVVVEGPALRGPIMPGGSAPLTLRVDPTDFTGRQARNVKLGTDDPAQGEYFLPVALTIRPDLTVDHLKRSMGEVAPHESGKVEYTFTRESGTATKLWVEGAMPPYLDLEIEPPAARPPGTPPGPAKGVVRLILRPSKLEPGMLAGLETLAVETSAPHQPRFHLYLDWRLRLPVLLSVSRVVFLEGQPAERALGLTGREGRPVALESVRLEGEGFLLDPLPAGPAPRLDLGLRRTATAAAKAMLVIKLKDEPDPIRVPVSYLPSGKGAPPS